VPGQVPRGGLRQRQAPVQPPRRRRHPFLPLAPRGGGGGLGPGGGDGKAPMGPTATDTLTSHTGQALGNAWLHATRHGRATMVMVPRRGRIGASTAACGAEWANGQGTAPPPRFPRTPWRGGGRAPGGGGRRAWGRSRRTRPHRPGCRWSRGAPGTAPAPPASPLRPDQVGGWGGGERMHPQPWGGSAPRPTQRGASLLDTRTMKFTKRNHYPLFYSMPTVRVGAFHKEAGTRPPKAKPPHG